MPAEAPKPPEPPQAAADLAVFDAIPGQIAALREQLHRVVVGQDDTIAALLIALLCRGHVLIVGVPGLAKTMLVRALARSLDLSFSRIQFTPDLMPSDILGTELIQEDPATGERHLRFVPGAVFAQLILADEINRTPPRTQAALLEAMAEHQVTVAGHSYRLDEPFVVVATQNPIEQEGTYALPEAQLDRFQFGLWMDYPSKAEEVSIVSQTPRIHAERLEPVVDRATLLHWADLVWRMPVSEPIVEYAVNLARRTRPEDREAPKFVRDFVAWGAGPRAGQFLIHAAKARAAITGLPTPGIKQVEDSAMAVLRHRLVLNYAATGQGVTAKTIVERLLAESS